MYMTRDPIKNLLLCTFLHSIIEPLDGGVDHFKLGECPGIPPSGSIVPVQENRYNDTAASQFDTPVQLATFVQHFKKIEQYSQNYATNFYVGHRPILGIGCNAGELVTLDWTLQQALGPSTLDRISAIITGHMQYVQCNNNLQATSCTNLTNLSLLLC